MTMPDSQQKRCLVKYKLDINFKNWFQMWFLYKSDINLSAGGPVDFYKKVGPGRFNPWYVYCTQHKLTARQEKNKYRSIFYYRIRKN